MEAKELRIGNYIQRKSNKSICTVNWGIIKDFELGKEVSDYEPISLTDQWLVDLGGYQDKSTWQFDFDNGFSEWIFQDGFIIDYDENLLCGNYMLFTFVHQFQNLIFSLTGKELTK
jgi:hypothetical protein